MAITKIQAGALPADVITTAAIDDASITHAKLHTTMDLSSKTVTLPTLSTLNTTGSVGIGTSSPSTQLEVKGSTYSLIRVNGGNTNNAGIDFGDTDDVDIGRIRYDNSSDAMQFWANNAERMRIDSSGNVGIGQSVPVNKLHVSGADGYAYLKLTSDSTGHTASDGSRIGLNGSDLRIINAEAASILFQTQNSERMRIDASGNVGIGTDTPNSYSNQTTLTINGATYGRLDLEQSGSLKASLVATTGSASLVTTTNILSFDTSGGEAMRIDGSGNVGIGTSSPRSELSIAANNSGQGAKLTLENTDTSITSNDVIGQIDFYANDGSTNGTGAKVNIKAIATSTAGTVTALTLGVANSASATAVETMRLKSDEVSWTNTTNGLYHKIMGPTSGDIASGYLTYNGSTLRGGFYTNPSHGLTVISDVDMSFRANNANRMHINTSGIVTTPYVPAFLAFKSNGALTSTQVVLWNNIYHNNGGHYSATTGKFTAPVDGYYSFTVGAIVGGSPVDGTQRNGELQLQKNGSHYGRGHWNMNDRWENVSYTQVMYLSANDEARVYFSNNTGNNEMYGASLYSHFGGFLIG
jgi:hypothetical protein